mgnify:FL=1
MGIIDYFKKQSRIMQVLDIIFVICLIYEIILVSLNMPFNGAITMIMGIIIFINAVKYLTS